MTVQTVDSRVDKLPIGKQNNEKRREGKGWVKLDKKTHNGRLKRSEGDLAKRGGKRELLKSQREVRKSVKGQKWLGGPK